MYATTVGLVLSGYRSLDERISRSYEEEPQQQPAYRPVQEVRPTAPPAPTQQQQQPAQPAPPKKPSGAGKFFQDIISRTKGLLIDDFDDKQY
jgi:cell division protein FtsA